MMRNLLCAVGLSASMGLVDAGRASAQLNFEQIVKKAEAKFEPAKARPGQTVTLKVTLELIDGWHTYPCLQPDKAAKAQTNKFTFPDAGPVVYVGELFDPENPKVKSEPVLGIDKMLYYPGGGAWSKKAVVLPDARAGSAASKVKFKILVCDKENCLPPRTLELEAPLTIAGEPVLVEPKYKAEVEKAHKK